MGGRAMAMAGASIAVFLALLCGVVSAQAPPAVDCSVAFNNLQPCIEFVNSNTSTAPSAPCCSAFASTQAQQPVCLCQLQQAFADPATAPGNATRAMEIPTLCKVAVDYNRCPALLGMAPAPAPGMQSPPMAAPPAGAPTTAPTTPPAAPGPAPPVVATPPVVPAPAPKGSTYDCTNSFNLLTPCLTFVSGDGKGAPPADCCTSLGTVQKNEPVCLCQLLAQVSNSSQYGVNATLAESLPKLCNVPADTSKCPALLGDAPASAPSAAVPAPAVATPATTPATTPVVAPVVAPTAPAPAVATPAATPAAPGPAGSTVDCSNEFASLQTCFAYVTANDSTPPPADCCSALQTVITNKPVCLCQLLQTVGSGDPAAQGINATRALDLPNVCKVKADVNKCPALLGQPVASPPASAPSVATSPPPPAGGAGGSPGASAPDIAPGPPGSGASTFRSTLATPFFTTLVGFAALVLAF